MASAGFPVTAGSGYLVAVSTYGDTYTPASGDITNYVKIDGGGNGLWVPIENGTAANLIATTTTKSLLVALPGQWSKLHTPAVNTQATITKAAGAAGVSHVCTWLSVSLANDSTGSAQTVLQFNLRDGATGAGTILWSITMALPATAGECRAFSISGLNIPGTAATAMTLESSGAPATHTAASVAFGGYDCV